MKLLLITLALLKTSLLFASSECGELFKYEDHQTDVLISELESPRIETNPSTNTGGLLYSPIYSTAVDVLKSFKFDEGPSPQRNMSIPPDPKDQYVFSSETSRILKQKAALTKRNPTKVIQYLEGYEKDVVNTVREQFERMLKEFGVYYPEIYDVTADSIRNKITGDTVTRKQVLSKKNGAAELLELVGKLVQEDWLLMKKDPLSGEYILIGGYLAFPTHWSLDRAIGWSLTQIHNNIPGTPESRAKFVQMIAMVLDRSLAAPDRVVVRNNWFLEADPRYAIPDYVRSVSKEQKSIVEIMSSNEPLDVKKEKIKKLLCLRVERQTLRGLPESGVVIFSINPHVYELETIFQNPDVAEKVLRGIGQKYPEATDSDIIGLAKKAIEEEVELSKMRALSQEINPSLVQPM